MPSSISSRRAIGSRGTLLLAIVVILAASVAPRAAAQEQDSAKVDVLFWISAVQINTYTAHILVANKTDRNIPFWSLVFDLDSEITFLNHALWEQDGSRVAIEGSGWTKQIPARDSVWVSFAVKYDSTFHEPRNCIFAAKPCSFTTNFEDTGDGNGNDGGDDGDGDNGNGGPVTSADVRVNFWYSSVWHNGYVAWIGIKNEGRTPVHGWSISFDFPQPIGLIWNGKLRLEGGRYTIHDDGWNRRISPGDSVAFGFQGVYAGVPRAPENCVFNGMDCSFANTFSVRDSQTPTSTEHSNASGFTLEVAPNPVHSLGRLEVGVNAAQHVRVELVDVRGRVVDILFDTFMTADASRAVTLDVSGLASGLYMVRMRGSEGFLTHRTVVVVR